MKINDSNLFCELVAGDATVKLFCHLSLVESPVARFEGLWLL